MLRDRRRVRNHKEIKLRLNQYEAKEWEQMMELIGGEDAAVLRDLAMEFAAKYREVHKDRRSVAA